MTSPLQPDTEPDLYYDSTSKISPLAPRKQHGVPVGTVAFRIMELRQLAISPKSKRSYAPVNYPREKSRTGFGRRIEPRFGRPASRSSKPDEDIHVDSNHSFSGLITHRRSHLEEHALVGRRAQWDRTPGLHGQLHPSGLATRAQYEATSPWSLFPKFNSSVTPQQDPKNQDVDVLANGSNGKLFESLIPLMSASPKALHYGAGEGSLILANQIAPKPQIASGYLAVDRRTAVPEGFSGESTSTVRRQSVKDLYYQYGIQRPAGLISSENLSSISKQTPHLLAKYRYCHICSRANQVEALVCECGHSLCESCESPLSEGLRTSDGSAESINDTLKRGDELWQAEKAQGVTSTIEISELAHLGKHYLTLQPQVQPTQEQLQRREASRKHGPDSSEKVDNIPATYSVRHLEEAMHRYEYWGTSPKYVHFPNPSSVLQEPPAALKASPSTELPSFPVVDTLSSTLPPSVSPTGMPIGKSNSHNLRYYHNDRRKNNGNKSSSSRSSSSLGGRNDSGSCKSSGCRATHRGYRPYRHSITCTRKRHRYPEETDSGYIAGASHLGEREPSLQSNLSHRLSFQGDHEEFSTSKREKNAFNKTDTSLRDKFQLRDALGERNRVYSSNLDTSADPGKDWQQIKEYRYQVNQTKNKMFAPNTHMEVEQPESSIDDTPFPLSHVKEREISAAQINRFQAEICKIGGSESKQEDIVKMPSQSTRNMLQSCPSNSNDISANTDSPRFRSNRTAALPTSAEQHLPEYRAGSQTDLTTDSAPSGFTQPLEDRSLPNPNAASRRLSKLLRLQEQKVGHLPNNQFHGRQDDLNRTTDDRINDRVQNTSLSQELEYKAVSLGNELNQQFTETKSEQNREGKFSSLSRRRRLQAKRWRGLGTDWQERIRGALSDSGHTDMTEKQVEKHDRTWERATMRDSSENAQRHTLHVAQVSIKTGTEGVCEACDVGIKGITMVIHLEGREDVVIVADLSQGV